MDLNEMSLTELENTMRELTAAIQQKRAQREAIKVENVRAIKDAIASIEALIGPESPTEKSVNSISEIRLYSEEEMGENAGIAIAKVLEGLDILARNSLATARVISQTI